MWLSRWWHLYQGSVWAVLFALSFLADKAKWETIRNLGLFIHEKETYKFFSRSVCCFVLFFLVINSKFFLGSVPQVTVRNAANNANNEICVVPSSSTEVHAGFHVSDSNSPHFFLLPFLPVAQRPLSPGARMRPCSLSLSLSLGAPPCPRGHFMLDAFFSPTCRQHIFQISTW